MVEVEAVRMYVYGCDDILVCVCVVGIELWCKKMCGDDENIYKNRNKKFLRCFMEVSHTHVIRRLSKMLFIVLIFMHDQRTM